MSLNVYEYFLHGINKQTKNERKKDKEVKRENIFEI